MNYSYSDRVRLDRYAIKSPNAVLMPGDLVIVSVQRKSPDGKFRESREIGTVVNSNDPYTVEVPEQAAEVQLPVVAETMGAGQQLLYYVPRHCLEYIVEKDWATICNRVSHAVLEVDKAPDAIEFAERVSKNMTEGKFIPAGRVLSGLGRPDQHDLTVYNCYVFSIPGDSRTAIAQHWGKIFETFSRGGGVGWDLSILRPKGAIVKKVNGRSSGVISWAEQFSQITGTVEQGGSRMGAALQGLWVWHPDIFDFIAAKSLCETIEINGQKITRNRNLLRNSNVSVLISNAFMSAVKNDLDWNLVFPDLNDPEYDTIWNGDIDDWTRAGKQLITYRTVKARELWQHIIHKAWESGEPGLLYIERANNLSNSYFYSKIKCVNPCGEQFLPNNAVCNLSHVNVSKFSTQAQLPTNEVTAITAMNNFDWTAFACAVEDGVRFLDNVIDLNKYHDADIEKQQSGDRRVGLGILGYGELLMRLGLRYGSNEALTFTDELFFKFWRHAYIASNNLARVRGAFPQFKSALLESGFLQQSHIKDSSPALLNDIKQYGLRNVTVTTVAPTGTISVILETTGGIEPYFDLQYTATTRIGTVEEKAGIVGLLTKQFGPKDNWPSYVVTAQKGITPEQHVKTQAIAQKWIDASISKCIAAGTLIPTDKGLIEVEAFATTHKADTFAPTNGEFKTSGHRILSHYRAGQKAATLIRLDNGAELVGATETHQVLTPDGWRRMAELKPGDLVIGRLQEAHGKGGMALVWTDVMRSNANAVSAPKHMTPEFAKFLGMIAADGHTTETTGCVGLTCKNSRVAVTFRKLCRKIFGVSPKEYTDLRNGVLCLYITSRNLVRFIESLIGRGAYNKHAPTAVLQGSYEEKIAFLTGITLDGYATPNGLVIYAGMSKKLAYHVAEIARSFGLPMVNMGGKWVEQTKAYAYNVVVSNEVQKLIIPIEPHKRRKTVYKRFKVLVDVQKIARSNFSSRSTEYYALRAAQNKNKNSLFNTTAKALGVSADIPVHYVTKIEDAGLVEMYDIEIEDAHEYVVNGMVSHNTINVPNSATVDDIANAYMMMWDLGCKGGTVYRDGSRDEQVFYTKATPTPPVSIPIDVSTKTIDAMRPRLEVGIGPTFSVPSPVGSLHVTIRHDPKTGDPEDIFITSGKGDITADVQAIGRLCSLILRLNGVPLSQQSKFELVREQLAGIPGRTQDGLPGQVRVSMPDTIAHVIERYLEGNFPLANMPFGAAQVDDLCKDFATMPQDTLGKLALYLKNQRASTPEPQAEPEEHEGRMFMLDLCPQCGTMSYQITGGCGFCHSCTHSRCG